MFRQCAEVIDSRSSIMFKHKSTKLMIFLTVAVVMVAAIALTACNGNAFVPKEMPAKGEIVSNGGSAVRYGDWLYYINGYESSSSAANTYEEVEARVGAVARIKIADLEKLFAVYDDSTFTSSSARTTEIAKRLKDTAEIVVPKFYYSGNSTSQQLNGIFIFGDRLYMLTPNDELTAGGNTQTNQSVLTSFKLDGSDLQRHYVFTNNAAQVMLGEVDGKVIATYIMDTEIGNVNVADGNKIVTIEDTASAQFDFAGKAVVYLDKDGAICSLKAGQSEAKVIVENPIPEGKKASTVTYSISSVNDGYVYYTKSDSTNSAIGNKCLYYATESVKDQVAFAGETGAFTAFYGYKDTVVYTDSTTVSGTTMYGIYVRGTSGNKDKVIVNPVQNDNSISFNRIDGNVLYYTSNNVAYKVDLSAETPVVEAYGASLASASNWYQPDVVGEYVITVSSGSVSVVKFKAETKTNSSSVTLTVVAATEED